jgi:hypothetical protein
MPCRNGIRLGLGVGSCGPGDLTGTGHRHAGGIPHGFLPDQQPRMVAVKADVGVRESPGDDPGDSLGSGAGGAGLNELRSRGIFPNAG